MNNRVLRNLYKKKTFIIKQHTYIHINLHQHKYYHNKLINRSNIEQIEHLYKNAVNLRQEEKIDAQGFVDIFKGLLQQGLDLNKVDLRSAFYALAEVDEGKRIIKLMGAVRQRDGRIPLKVFISATVAMIENGLISMAKTLLDERKQLGIDVIPSIHVSRLIRALTQNNNMTEAFELYDNIIDISGEPPNLYVYHSLIIGCGKIGNSSKLEEIINQMTNYNIKYEERTYSNILTSYAKCGEVEKAEGLWSLLLNNYYQTNRLPSNESYFAMLYVYARNFRHEKTIEFGQLMKKSGINMTEESFATLWNCVLHSVSKAPKSALNVFYRLLKDDKTFQPSGQTYGIILTSLCRDKRIDDAEAIIESMIQAGNINTEIVHPFNVMLLEYSRLGDLDKMNNLVMKMSELKITLDRYSYHAFMSYYVNKGLWKEVLTVFDQMTENKVQVNAHSFTYILKALSKHEGPAVVQEAVERYLVLGNKLDAYHYSNLIFAFSRYRDLDSMCYYFDELLKHELMADSLIFESVIRSLCINSSFSKALNYLRKMYDYPLKSSKKTKEYNLRKSCNIIIAFCKQQSQDDFIHDVFDWMKSVNIKPSIDTARALTGVAPQSVY